MQVIRLPYGKERPPACLLQPTAECCHPVYVCVCAAWYCFPESDSSYQAYQVVKDSYSRPGYDSYTRAQQPSADLPQPSSGYSYQNPPQYPNANPGYVNRGYQPADDDMPAPYHSGAATNQPLRGSQPGYDKYQAPQPAYDSKYPSYDSKYSGYDKYPGQAAYGDKYPSYDRYPSQPGYDSKYPGYDSKNPSQSGYNSKYPAYDKAYQPGYDSKYPVGGYGSAGQYPSDSYARTKPQPPQDSYWQSYQPAPKPTSQPAGRGYYGDRAAEYSVYGLDVAKSQQGVSGSQMYRVTAEGAYPLPASPSVPLAGARQHLPTVVHMDEAYKQQQQQQQLLASLRTGSSLLGSSGYGGAYKQSTYGSAVLSTQPALQPGGEHSCL